MEAQAREIPSPHADDDEDVSWALSTATALWASGERAEALKWLRRAAETASDNNADSRALELFKAAAEVATKLASIPPPSSARPTAPGSLSNVPGPPSTAPGPASAAAASSARPPQPSGGPPPAAAARSVAPRVPTQRPSALPAGEARSPGTAPPPRSSSEGRIARSPDSVAAPTTPAARRDAHPAPAPSSVSGAASSARVPATKRTDAPPAPIPAPAPIPTGLGPRLEPTRDPPSRSLEPTRDPPSRSLEPTRDPPSRSLEPTRDPPSRSLEPTRDPPSRSLEPAPAARPSTAARVRPRPTLDRRPQDDEVTITRDFSRQLASMSAASSSDGARYDDLEEETNVLSGTATDGGVRLSAGRGGVLDARPTELAPPIQDEPTGSSPGSYDQATPTDLPGASAGSPWPGRALSVVPALRVVVLATSVAGEVRLMPLAPGSQAPTGAAVATLVPATEEDADAIVRLFDSTR